MYQCLHVYVSRPFSLVIHVSRTLPLLGPCQLVDCVCRIISPFTLLNLNLFMVS